LIARRDKMVAYFELIAQKGESQVLLLIRAATRLALARGVLQPLWRNPFRSNPFHFGSAFRFQNNFRFPLDFGVPWAENPPEIASPKSSSQPFGSAAPPEAKR